MPAPLAITPAAPGSRTVDLVGRNSTGSTSRNADYVVAPLVDIPATGLPGASASATSTIGRYAWWVGDQGVKAPVAIPDTSDTVAGAPFDSAELRGRIRQQISIGAGAADAGVHEHNPAGVTDQPGPDVQAPSPSLARQFREPVRGCLELIGRHVGERIGERGLDDPDPIEQRRDLDGADGERGREHGGGV